METVLGDALELARHRHIPGTALLEDVGVLNADARGDAVNMVADGIGELLAVTEDAMEAGAVEDVDHALPVDPVKRLRERRDALLERVERVTVPDRREHRLSCLLQNS